MSDKFTEQMLDRFREMIGTDLLRNVGKSFDFRSSATMRVIKSFSRVQDRSTASFLLSSNNWANTRLDMFNNLNEVFPTMAERRPVEAYMRNLVADLRPKLDEQWSRFVEHSTIAQDFVEGMGLPADFMFYCRESYIASIGFAVPGYFSDIFSVYEMGVLPCGWDGPFPSGDLLIY